VWLGAHSPAASVTHAATSTSATTGCSQINSALNSVFDGSYAALPAAKTTDDLLSNFLGQTTPVTSALAPIMAEHGTAPGLRAAEAQLNADVNRLDNTSYVSSAQEAVIIPDLKAISDICSSATWTKVTLTVVSVTPNGTPTAAPGGAPTAAPVTSPSAAAPSAPASAAFVPQTLLSVSASGDTTTAQFTVGGSGDYDVIWSYNEGTFGQSVNFDFVGDNGRDMNLTGPNQLGSGGSGVTHVYGDAGTHFLTVLSEGDWTINVVTAE
jgi:hypothetical protein